MFSINIENLKKLKYDIFILFTVSVGVNIKKYLKKKI